ncbi:hypothetical protein M514_08377 [Trichuris suis]|uniref:Uncharacterized protein n=1 Tax=Trichuris suis TaxID=68888 RepID=A0A085M0H5_9BILA|nr:hypothetical protein M513_08377 [Trichuris suis]KFD63174.1 hypothetical protein M514_08377 [Trichuris suis]
MLFHLYKNVISMFICNQCYGREQQLVVSIRPSFVLMIKTSRNGSASFSSFSIVKTICSEKMLFRK